jgi:hypothetical protein
MCRTGETCSIALVSKEGRNRRSLHFSGVSLSFVHSLTLELLEMYVMPRVLSAPPVNVSIQCLHAVLLYSRARLGFGQSAHTALRWTELLVKDDSVVQLCGTTWRASRPCSLSLCRAQQRHSRAPYVPSRRPHRRSENERVLCSLRLTAYRHYPLDPPFPLSTKARTCAVVDVNRHAHLRRRKGRIALREGNASLALGSASFAVHTRIERVHISVIPCLGCMLWVHRAAGFKNSEVAKSADFFPDF